MPASFFFKGVDCLKMMFCNNETVVTQIFLRSCWSAAATKVLLLFVERTLLPAATETLSIIDHIFEAKMWFFGKEQSCSWPSNVKLEVQHVSSKSFPSSHAIDRNFFLSFPALFFVHLLKANHSSRLNSPYQVHVMLAVTSHQGLLHTKCECSAWGPAILKAMHFLGDRFAEKDQPDQA